MTRSRSVPIPLSRPDIGASEVEQATSALLSGRLALGPQTRDFERRMSTLTGSRHAIAVSSGTAALHLILEAMGIGPGDEVITTPFSFVATANAALYVGARPVFAEIDPTALNIHPAAVEAQITPKTRAILGVDVFGQPADWRALRRIAKSHDLLLVDDGCEALGASVDDRPVGSLADATAFGFYPNKQITTGEGGCITTDNSELADICRSLANQGRSSRDRMHHVRLGYNYRLSEVAAAVGCAQLDRFEELQAKREALAELYTELLGPIEEDIVLPLVAQNTSRSWFAYVVRLSDRFSATARDQLIVELKSLGIESAAYFPCIHLQPLYRERFGHRKGMYPLAEAASDRTLALPFFTSLDDESVEYVVSTLAGLLPGLPKMTRRQTVAVGDR